MLSQVLVLGVVAVLSLSVTGLVRWLALANNVVDSPNERSSHLYDTPTGGGLGIALSFLVGLLAFWYTGDVSERDLMVLAPAGGALAIIGFWDDLSPVSPLLRLFVQFLCAFGVLVGYGMPDPESTSSIFHSLLLVPGLLGLVWLVNLYNFMDGIDGIASLEAISVVLGWALIAFVFQRGDWLIPLLLASTVAGFLFWNFPPAKIFMGDAGSVFLGLVIGAMAVQSSVSNLNNLYVWGVLLGVFIVDASITIITRVLRGENPLRPHRSHAYQIAAQLWGSHKRVTLVTVGINVVWLLPIAALIASGKVPGSLGLLVAYLPIIFLAVKLGAGRSNECWGAQIRSAE